MVDLKGFDITKQKGVGTLFRNPEREQRKEMQDRDSFLLALRASVAHAEKESRDEAH